LALLEKRLTLLIMMLAASANMPALPSCHLPTPHATNHDCASERQWTCHPEQAES
jgi:hypothetical protein